MKIIFIYIILSISVTEKGISQTNKFIIDELKTGLYYASDTTTQKEVLYLNKELKKINQDNITDGTIFYKNYANVRVGKKYGFIDNKGKVTLFPEYSTIVWTENDFGSAIKDGKIGFIDRKGKVVIPFNYDMTTFFYNGYAVVRNGTSYSVINEKGDNLISSNKVLFPPFKDLNIPFITDSGQAIMSREKIIKSDYYKSLISADNEYIKAIKNNNIYGLMNSSGKIVIPFEYEKIKFLNLQSLIPAKKNGKWGYIDIKNREIINFKYDEVNFFSEDLAAVVMDKKVGFINKKGDIVINPKFDFSWNSSGNYNFKNNLCAFFKDKKWGFIDKTGKEIIPPIYEYVGCFNNEKSIVGLNKKFGIINKKGEIVLPIIYDKIQLSDNGFYKVVKGIDSNPVDNSMENIDDILLFQTLFYLYQK